ncbi:TlpA family protein disulfide reductase [Paenibacillus antri]|uniref:TlpA family protein disulfide reductase n=1 Tax=Paenibacillus antri TaxID=2582848 RepID=A0A5R9GA86_9BACL|nr:TlpA disulfide reductase family protein [Paenibacillus antri]TLS50288.1 TlpA family protein disulfide reductase [Paenibacillus antri]
MFILQLGPLSLNGPLLLLLWFGASGYAVVRASGIGEEAKERIRSALLGGGILWLLVWKTSLLWLDPQGVLAHPSSLLYLDGGTTGRYAATGIAVVYAAFRWRDSPRLLASGAAALVLYAASGAFAMQLGYAALGRPEFAPATAAAAALATGVWFAVRHAWRRAATVRKAAIESAVWVVAAALLLGVAAEAADVYEARVRESAAGVGSAAGQLAPDVELTLPDGATAPLSAYRGRPVFVNFWASWCPPCRAEMPSLQRLHETFDARGVAVLAVNMATTEARPDAGERYLAERGFTMPAVSDASGEAKRAFRVRAYPTSFAIDADGVIVGRYEGAMHYRAMAEELERLLSPSTAERRERP